ncbi:MAG: hypothetical protein Q8P18_26845 [Pseudomonadota bacterium]|nr:hypothetical protein [Pseudomonadota bacterium]
MGRSAGGLERPWLEVHLRGTLVHIFSLETILSVTGRESARRWWFLQSECLRLSATGWVTVPLDAFEQVQITIRGMNGRAPTDAGPSLGRPDGCRICTYEPSPGGGGLDFAWW